MQLPCATGPVRPLKKRAGYTGTLRGPDQCAKPHGHGGPAKNICTIPWRTQNTMIDTEIKITAPSRTPAVRPGGRCGRVLGLA